jgi:hypothetical protein
MKRDSIRLFSRCVGDHDCRFVKTADTLQGVAMLQRTRRPVAILSLLLLLLNTCYNVRKQPIGTVIQPNGTVSVTERIVGVTLNDGREISFDRNPSAVIRGDSFYATVNRTTFVIPVSEVQRVWVESIDKTKTTLAVFGNILGVAAAVGIMLATKQSCPFVYSWDGTQYVFDGEPLGGAVTRGLERDDYSKLEHLRADRAGLYRLMVTNEVNETQYTNSMRLLVVDHKPGTRFEMDEWGKLHSVTRAISLASARDQDGRDLAAWLRSTDQLIWEPLPATNPNGPVRQEIVLTFPKPRDATRANLVARAGTGMWGSHMIRELLELRGSQVSEWYAAVDSGGGSRDALRAWNVREELYVLKLDIDESGTWRTRGLLPGGGPFLTETRVVPLDVSAVTGDSLRIRIRPPSGFWAMNSFAVTYDDDAEQPLAVTAVDPLTARTSDDRDVLGDLRAADDRYYVMPNTGDAAQLTFAAPPARAGTERTVFLHTRGYYRLHLPEKGPADLAALQRIADQPDAVARLAAESFAKRRVARSGN